MRAKPQFIVLEGIDGVGTTTHVGRLCERLQADGVGVQRSFEPSAGPIGTLLRQVLSGRLRQADAEKRVGPGVVAALFAADRLDHLESELLPALAQGNHVVSDRYLLSSLAYQTVECDSEWVQALNAKARAPDLTIFLDLSAEQAEARRRGRSGPSERYDALEVQAQVAARYRELCAAAQGRGPMCEVLGPVERVDASGRVEEVGERIYQLVSRHLGLGQDA